jgi:hypothetical protein
VFKAPFDGTSVSKVLQSIRAFQDVRWYDLVDKHSCHPCKVLDKLSPALNLPYGGYGLNLVDCSEVKAYNPNSE